MKILVYGALNIDLVFRLERIVRPGETVSGASLTRSAGGKGANQAAALAKAGMDVYMAGKIGEDGAFLLGLLRSYGVNTGHVARYGGATGQAMIQVDDAGQNAIVLHPGGNGEITSAEVDAALAGFGAGDTVVVQNEIVRVGEIIEKAAAKGLAVCLNPSPCDANVEALPLDLVDMFFVNEIEGAALAGLPPAASTAPAAILDALTARFPAAEVALTCGPAGAYYARGGLRAHAPAAPAEVVDTTGAGDTFTGYFVAARRKGLAVDQALALACKAAAIAVSRPGAMEAIPLAEEVF